MLTEKQVKEIREHLNAAQNPLFYYDNDADGLCSFVILRKYIGRGKGVAVRSFPNLDGGYVRKARELNSDYIFVLDKPVLSKEFVDEVKSLNIPLVWIDHHDVESEISIKNEKNIFYYNPAKNKGKNKSEEPVTYWSYKIANKVEDIWLAIIGCIADHYLPDFSEQFKKKFPEFWGKVKEPFDAYYNTEIGKIAQALNFGLKDSISNVIRMQNFLISAKSPAEIFLETYANSPLRKKYSELKTKHNALLEKAINSSKEENLIFFSYSGDVSMSADLSNELSFRYPKKYIVVAYKNGLVTNLSLRGKNVKRVLESVLKKVEGKGGGHENAVGARINTSDIENFKEILLKEIKK